MYSTCIFPLFDEFGVKMAKIISIIHIKLQIPPFLALEVPSSSFEVHGHGPFPPHLLLIRPRMRANAQASYVHGFGSRDYARHCKLPYLLLKCS